MGAVHRPSIRCSSKGRRGHAFTRQGRARANHNVFIYRTKSRPCPPSRISRPSLAYLSIVRSSLARRRLPPRSRRTMALSGRLHSSPKTRDDHLARASQERRKEEDRGAIVMSWAHVARTQRRGGGGGGGGGGGSDTVQIILIRNFTAAVCCCLYREPRADVFRILYF
jgi:hypothetical protein